MNFSKPRIWVTWNCVSVTWPASSSLIVILAWPSMRDTWSIVIFFMAGLLASAGCARCLRRLWPAGSRRAPRLRRRSSWSPCPPYPNRSLEPRSGSRPSSSSLSTEQDRVGLGRAAGDVDVDLDRRVERLRLLEQRGHAVRRARPAALGRALDVDALEQLAGGDAVAHRRHVAGHRAVAERHHDLAAGPRGLRELEVVLAADRALDHGHVDALGPLLRVDQRAEHDVGLLEHGDDPLVDVEQRHVAARAAVEPAGADLQLVHHWPSRIEVRRLTTVRCLVISSTPQPFSAIAPVGQAWTHLPQLVQVVASPHGRCSSETSRDCDAAAGDVPHVRALDLGARAHAARAQHAAVVVEHVARVRGVDREPRVVVRVADVRDAVVLGQGLQLAVARGDAHGADVVALGEQQLERDLPVGLELRRAGGDRQALLHGRGAGGQQPRDAGDLDHAQPAGADRAEALHVAEGRDVLVVGPRDLEDRLAGGGRDHLAVDADLHLLGQGDPPYLSTLRMSQRRQRDVSSIAATAVRPSETSAYDCTRWAAGISAGHVAAALARRLGRLHLVRRTRGTGSRSAPAPSAACRCCGRPSCRCPWRSRRSRRR